MKWWHQMPWSSFSECWALSQLFHSFTFIKRLFSSSLSAIRVVSSAHLRLLIFLLAILFPAYASSSPAFLIMYTVYKLNKQGDNIQPWRTPFPIWNQSVGPCPVLTVVSWPAYISQEAGQVVWYSHLFQNFPQFIMIHKVKGFGIVKNRNLLKKKTNAKKPISSFALLIWSKDEVGKVSVPLPALNTEMMCHIRKVSQLWWDWEAVTSWEAEGVTKALDFMLLGFWINGDLAASGLLGSCS